jgi:hypothetical protein
MRNLLEETIEALKQHDKTPKDVLWCGCRTHYFDWADFEKVANVEYDSGYGGQEVAEDLLIVGNGFWLERHEYDGSEWWEYKTAPVQPTEKMELKALTVGQASDASCGWENLLALNNIKSAT